MVISKKTIIFQGLRGGPTYSGEGVQLFVKGGGGPYAHFYSYQYNFLLRNCIKMNRTPTVFIVELADLIYKLP